jgi:hypothetical protein
MVQTMSTITLEQAQAQLAALMAAQASNLRAVSIAGRSVSYASMAEMIEAINYWTRMVNILSRQADGVARHGYRVADFRRAP